MLGYILWLVHKATRNRSDPGRPTSKIPRRMYTPDCCKRIVSLASTFRFHYLYSTIYSAEVSST